MIAGCFFIVFLHRGQKNMLEFRFIVLSFVSAAILPAAPSIDGDGKSLQVIFDTKANIFELMAYR